MPKQNFQAQGMKIKLKMSKFVDNYRNDSDSWKVLTIPSFIYCDQNELKGGACSKIYSYEYT